MKNKSRKDYLTQLTSNKPALTRSIDSFSATAKYAIISTWVNTGSVDERITHHDVPRVKQECLYDGSQPIHYRPAVIYNIESYENLLFSGVWVPGAYILVL